MSNLDKLIDQLEQNIPYSGTLNKEISQSDVAWHIEHALLTLGGIADALVKSDPREYKWSFNFIRMVVMTTKKIPRGRAKAPKVVQPKGDLTAAGLQKHVSETRNKIKALDGLSKDKYFEHPFFGNLKLGQTLSFLEIHTKHHLSIIEDIKQGKDKGQRIKKEKVKSRKEKVLSRHQGIFISFNFFIKFEHRYFRLPNSGIPKFLIA